MADILDPKQDVIKFELTSHGRTMLGLGLLQPEYVSFFDSNVIYDSAYVGEVSEEQNSIQGRILDNTMTFGMLSDDERFYKNPLGNSSLTSQFAPTWNINLLSGKQSYIQANSSYFQKYFELSDINYEAKLIESDNLFFESENISVFELDNGMSVDIKEDYILLDIEELNSDDDFKNFEIELFIQNGNTGTYKVKTKNNIDPDGYFMDQLSFYEKPSNIIDGILYEDSELPSKYRKIDLKSTDAEYYLDILVDEEIDKELILNQAKPIPESVAGTYSTNITGPAKDDC
jgi:hypothetical protein